MRTLNHFARSSLPVMLWLNLWRIFLAAAFCAGLLAGCQQPTVTELTAVPTQELPTQAPPSPVVVLVENTPTDESLLSQDSSLDTLLPVTTPTPAMIPAPISVLKPSATPLPAPQLLYPITPTLAPTTTWRPAGYPVPWAPTIYDHFYFARPIPADEANSPLQDYRYGGDFLGDVIHTGVDYPAAIGTDVLAAGPGKIIWAGYGLYRGYKDETDPYGIAVAIQHDFGWQNQKLYTIYGHLSEVLVVPGQRVETGDLIGLSGETGKVTGPHLHFEVRVGENSFFATRNPELWVVPPQGWGVLAGRVMNSGGQIVAQQNIIVTSLKTDENWFSRSYAEGAVISDPYYRENIVIGDLPAGAYRIRIAYAGFNLEARVEIRPGQVNYFEFWGFDGFKFNDLPAPGISATPAP